MSKKFAVSCSKCGQPVEFKVQDIPALEAAMLDRVMTARADGYQEGIEELRDTPSLSRDARRPMMALAIAIRRGDIAEAEYQLDRIAEEFGDGAVEQVQQGRFSPQAKRVTA